MPVVPQLHMRMHRYYSNSDGKWQSYKSLHSNLSFIVNVVLHRHPEYYVRTCRKWSIENFRYYHISYIYFCCKSKIFNLLVPSAVASMGQGGAIAPPILGVATPIGSCPGHSRKPAFGNGAIAS